MNLKQRIEAMKLPGHNGPSLRESFKTSPRAVALLLKRLNHISTMPIRRDVARMQAEQFNINYDLYYNG